MGPVHPQELGDFARTEPVSRANQAVACSNIARSSRSSRTSRRSRRHSSSSKLVNPSFRRPSSRSAWRAQIRIAEVEHSNSRVSSPGVRPARTEATRRSSDAGTLARTAVVSSTPGELLCAMFGCPPKPGQLRRRFPTSRSALPTATIAPSSDMAASRSGVPRASQLLRHRRRARTQAPQVARQAPGQPPRWRRCDGGLCNAVDA